MSDRLTAALVRAARTLEDAHRRAHSDAHRCRNCGEPFTTRIRDAESAVLHAARELGKALLDSAGEEEK